MSDPPPGRRPGSRAWWVETAWVVFAGLLLAFLLWDGPVFDADPRSVASRPTMADLLQSGCLSGGDLQALRDGGRVVVDPECLRADPRP